MAEAGNIAVAILVRDEARRLPKFLEQLERLSNFKDLKFLFVENDSIDNTVSMLQSWMSQKCPTSSTIISKKYGTKKYGSTRDKERVKNLAELSNQLIGYILEVPMYRNCTHVLMVDANYFLPTNLIVDLAGLKKDIVAPLVLGGGEMFYDVWSFQKDGHEFRHDPPYFTGYKRGIFELSSVGACYLVDRKVLEAGVVYGIDYNWDACHHSVFCHNARQKGFKVWCDGFMEIHKIG